MKYGIAITLCVGLFFTLEAQDAGGRQKYLNGKAFYLEGKYMLAMEVLKPLTQGNPDDEYAPYAAFYYALAAFKSNYLPMSKNMLLQIKAKYPAWPQRDEVNYWLGVIYMQLGQYNLATGVLNEIGKKPLKQIANALKSHYFNTISDKDQLLELYNAYPNERTPGYLLAKAIAREPFADQDRDLLSEIIAKFQFDAKEFSPLGVSQSVFKDQYKVAVLLPFMVDKLTPDTSTKVNQFVFDLYNGILLAVEKLNQQGVKIKLYAYDTERSKRATGDILNRQELKGMDLIIGPLFSQPIALVSDFCRNNKINFINPLSSNSATIEANPFAFLFFPDNETIGRLSAEFVLNKSNLKKKTAIIIYEDNPNDAAKAMAYRERIEADSSIEIVDIKNIDKDDSQMVLDMLLEETEDSKTKKGAEQSDDLPDYTIGRNSLGHIFVASANHLISSKIMSAVETRGDSILVIGSAEWLDLPSIKLETYYRTGTVLYAPNYADRFSRAFKAFRKSYIDKYHSLPDKYAQTGFDLMYVTGQYLSKYGKYFQLGLKEAGITDGYLSDGFDYSGTNYNNYMPMIGFRKGEIKVISYKND